MEKVNLEIMRKMEKVNLEIQDYEDKKSQAGKRYTRFKTNQGWMSAFDKKLIEDLKSNEGKFVIVDMAIDEERGFKNIKKFYGVAEANLEEPVKKEVISESKNNHTTMYVSYAKDLIVSGKAKTVEVAIEIVKKLREAFE